MADLALNTDQAGLQDAAAKFFRAEVPIARVRAAEPSGFDPELWSKVVELGFATMGLPEKAGGVSAGALDLVIVAQEYGRSLAPVPLVESTVASRLITRAAPEHRLTTSIANGSLLPTLALNPVGGRPQLVPAGSVANVVIGLRADALVAYSRPGRVPLPKIPNLADLPLAQWSWEEAECEVLAEGEAALALYQDARTEWKLLTAAALNGLREQALHLGVEYVKQRIAFGVPIGSFQAVQHRLANDAAAGDGARLLTYEAAWARDERLDNAAALASMAFIFGANSAFQTCRSSLQFHGGYGFTLEYDIQLFFRRAKSWPLLAGPMQDELECLAGQVYGDRRGD
jgi:alkylation response protein AidB-like acyl-CoA dehydrogenase